MAATECRHALKRIMHFPLNGYKCFRMDRSKRRGGGICIYTREKLNALCVEPLHNAGKFELMFVEVSASDTPSTKYCICLCYHPPKSAYSVHEMIENLTANLSHFADTGNYDVIVFTGDLNSLKCDDLMESLGLTQIVDKPTRANRTLDVHYTNRPDLFSVTVARSLVKSDHLAVFVNCCKDDSTDNNNKQTWRKVKS